MLVGDRGTTIMPVDTSILDSDMGGMEDDWPATFEYDDSVPLPCIIGQSSDGEYPADGGIENTRTCVVSVRKSVADAASIDFRSMTEIELNGDGVRWRIQNVSLAPDNVEYVLFLVDQAK